MKIIKNTKLITLITLLTTSSSVHAIPPPDVVISLWQTLLQFFGMAAAFIATAWFAFRQTLNNYGITWKHITTGIVGLVCISGGLIWYSDSPQTAQAKILPQGEMLTIEQVIQREPSVYIRNWKFETSREMMEEVIQARQQKGLQTRPLQTIPSFSPKALAAHISQNTQQIYLLDTREAFERTQFNIGYQEAIRYADLIYDEVPKTLPKDKTIVVLCHSGIRGYFAANFLKQAGYNNVAFLQGGLASWEEAKLPVNGDKNYSFQPTKLDKLNKAQVEQAQAVNIQLDTQGKDLTLNSLVRLPLELSTSEQINQALEAAKDKPIVLACQSYSGCFHTGNLAHLLKERGHDKLMGAYDASGKYLK